MISHLRARLPDGWQATLRAVDGSMVEDVEGQLTKLPQDATHLVVSAGGNNALDNANILSERAQSAADVLNRLAAVAERFQKHYRQMLEQVLSHQLPTAVCSVYYPRMPDPVLQRLAVAALAIFNDAIIVEASRAGVPQLDLRLICNDEADYANEIEPSVRGGEKIVTTILKVISEHDFLKQRTEIFR